MVFAREDTGETTNDGGAAVQVGFQVLVTEIVEEVTVGVRSVAVCFLSREKNDAAKHSSENDAADDGGQEDFDDGNARWGV